jgi:FixJ family two-component response regulator
MSETDGVVFVENEVPVRASLQNRQHVMEKMGARSLADLVRMADRLGIPTPEA